MAGVASTLLGAACSSTASPDSHEGVGQSAAALASNVPYLYFECNATGWNISEANRLEPTSDPATFTLTYQVTEPWLVSSPDKCLIVATNQLDGYGTAQVYYSDPHPSVAVTTPGSGSLISSNQTFAVSYPKMGGYSLTVNSQTNTFSIAPATTGGIVGDCGLGPQGSNSSVMVDYVLVYSSNLTRWCVDSNVWSASSNGATIGNFFGYGDSVFSTLQSSFRLAPKGPFVYEVTDDTSGVACAGCSPFGVGETLGFGLFQLGFGDPVSGASIPGFWVYLLTLHEAINNFTGQVTYGGWPADWWADHRSPFPNTIDEYVMRMIGTEQGNQTLLAAANAQHERMAVSTLPGYDPEVAMFNTLYNQDGGFTGFANTFALLDADGIALGTHNPNINPSPLLTEYTIAYLQLGIRTKTDLTQSLFVASGVGTLDTTIPAYAVDASAVRAIGNAHCSIRAASAAGVNVGTALSALQTGNYASATASGGTQASCPSECAWNATTSRCAAPW
jgi:hypothetical protein